MNVGDKVGIAEYISSMSNASAMHGEENAYLVWGVHNDTHEFTIDDKRVQKEMFRKYQRFMDEMHLNIFSQRSRNTWMIMIQASVKSCSHGQISCHRNAENNPLIQSGL